MPDSLPKFQLEQFAFTAHLRDPEHNPGPKGIEDRRMEIYRGLLYRNVQNFLANAFPVLRKIYCDEDWHSLVRTFFSTHKSQSPYFKDISKEFLHYLTEEHEMRPVDPAFLQELAHYEWIEIQFTLMDCNLRALDFDPKGDLLQGIPVVSPLAEMFSYRFPVHRIRPDLQPQEPAQHPTFLTVYRNSQDKVGFMEMNPVSARLMELLRQNKDQSGQDLLIQISTEIPSIQLQTLLEGGHSTLKRLREVDILLGTQRL